MKKNIKIQLIGWEETFNINILPFINNEAIKSKFDINISNNPDFVIFGPYGNIQDLIKYPNAINIYIPIYEPYYPDFLLMDYCVGFEPSLCYKRYCYFPMFLIDIANKRITIDKINSHNDAQLILNHKSIFCDFIYGHETSGGLREKYFKLISSYKKVESAGTFLNNQSSNKIVSFFNNDDSKFKFQSKCKFSIVIQSVDADYFINEKIIHSIAANTIPIFYGPNNVSEIINPKRFINIKDYKTDRELLNKIIEIDNNDELFCSIISEPTFIEKDYLNKTVNKATNFFIDIFNSNAKQKFDVKWGKVKFLNKILSYEQNQNTLNKIRNIVFFWRKNKNNK